MHSNNVEGLLKKLGVFEYNPNDWRLFIDSCKRSLKCVLLHNGSAFGSNPLGHSTTHKEKYSEIKFVGPTGKIFILWTQLDHLCWFKNGWISTWFGLQCGYSKFPCFLCLWDSRARAQHWIKQDWPVREELVPGEKNVQAHPLVERSKIILPPLHIKLGIMKQFVKALNKDGDCFKYICTKFPGSTIEKLKAVFLMALR